MTAPDKKGYYGSYGGRFVPETLVPLVLELERFYRSLLKDSSFWREWQNLLQEYGGRPTPLYFAKRLSQHLGGHIKVYLKKRGSTPHWSPQIK